MSSANLNAASFIATVQPSQQPATVYQKVDKLRASVRTTKDCALKDGGEAAKLVSDLIAVCHQTLRHSLAQPHTTGLFGRANKTQKEKGLEKHIGDLQKLNKEIISLNSKLKDTSDTEFKKVNSLCKKINALIEKIKEEEPPEDEDVIQAREFSKLAPHMTGVQNDIKSIGADLNDFGQGLKNSLDTKKVAFNVLIKSKSFKAGSDAWQLNRQIARVEKLQKQALSLQNKDPTPDTFESFTKINDELLALDLAQRIMGPGKSYAQIRGEATGLADTLTASISTDQTLSKSCKAYLEKEVKAQKQILESFSNDRELDLKEATKFAKAKTALDRLEHDFKIIQEKNKEINSFFTENKRIDKKFAPINIEERINNYLKVEHNKLRSKYRSLENNFKKAKNFSDFQKLADGLNELKRSNEKLREEKQGLANTNADAFLMKFQTVIDGLKSDPKESSILRSARDAMSAKNVMSAFLKRRKAAINEAAKNVARDSNVYRIRILELELMLDWLDKKLVSRGQSEITSNKKLWESKENDYFMALERQLPKLEREKTADLFDLPPLTDDSLQKLQSWERQKQYLLDELNNNLNGAEIAIASSLPVKAVNEAAWDLYFQGLDALNEAIEQGRSFTPSFY